MSPGHRMGFGNLSQFVEHVYLWPQALSPCSRKRPTRCPSLQEHKENVAGLGLTQCREEGACIYRVSSSTRHGT